MFVSRQIISDLPRDGWLELFDLWIEYYVGKRERERAEAFANVVATPNDYARAPVPADPFVCPCGAALEDPCDRRCPESRDRPETALAGDAVSCLHRRGRSLRTRLRAGRH